jgi:Tfp pilus assembly protein PilF
METLFVSFHWNHTRLFDLAEKYYLIAIKLNPENVWPVCNYATFLWDVKKRLDESQKV